ncbi:MAG: hypothetical protein JRI36_00890 [Deltaproteobacteria bacterium]|nr:hypothetical protein [Deltaproteobacteria bacterium]
MMVPSDPPVAGFVGDARRWACRRAKARLILGIVLLVWVVTAGCATTKKIADDIMGDEPRLKKKIVVLSAARRLDPGGADLAGAAASALEVALAEDCDAVKVIGSQQVRSALEAVPRLTSGELDNLALAQAGRIHGVNAVLETGVVDMHVDKEKRGIWGFRDLVPVLRAAFRVRVYDVETTATMMDEVFEQELDLTDMAWEDQGPGVEAGQYVRPLLVEVIPKMADAVCDRLSAIPWSGFVVRCTKGTCIVSAGKDVGLAQGDVLEVFKMADPVQGFAGRVYLMAGPKAGELKISRVLEHQAEAVGIAGDDFERSCCVRLKP